MSGRPELDLALVLLRQTVADLAAAPAERACPTALPAEVDWQRFVRLTSSHFILPAIAKPLARLGQKAPIPSDLLAFVAEMRSANEVRNRELGAALGEITRCLAGVGIGAVALKGAAFLAEDPHYAAGWRFMNDLDLLVRPEELEAAVAAVEALGYRPEHREYDPVREAHYPPLIAPNGRFCVEIHTRLFGLDHYGIDVERLRSDAMALEAWGASLRVPSPVDRVAHAVVHAQLHNRQYAARRIVLKDVLDLGVMPVSARAAVLAPSFGRPPFARFERNAVEALLLAADRLLFGSGALQVSLQAGRWAAHAIDRLAWSERRAKLATPADLVRLEATRLWREPGHLSRRLQLATSPARLAGALDRFTWKQRQRLWS